MFRVTLINLTESRKDSWEYANLLDAMRVAKNVDTAGPDDLMARPAMSDEFFNTHLWELLTMGFVYVRDDVMVFLWKVTGNEERPVVSALDMVSGVAMMPIPPVEKTFIPNQFPVEPLVKFPVEDANVILGED